MGRVKDREIKESGTRYFQNPVSLMHVFICVLAVNYIIYVFV